MNNKKHHLTSFDRDLSLGVDNIEFELRGFHEISWLEFLLNPRRLRGSDFLMRWSQGLWSEKRLTDGINETDQYFAIPYGTSSTAPENDIRRYELYFELLDQAGHGDIKRPDLLIFNVKDREFVQSKIDSMSCRHRIPFLMDNNSNHQEYLEGVEIFPFIHEDDEDVRSILSTAIIAVECENSLWIAKQMPDFDTPLTPMRRLGGQPGLKKGAVLPTVIIKEEDRVPLITWQKNSGVKIHVWHVFFDLAYGLALDEAERLISTGLIEPSVQTFQAPNGVTTSKAIYKFYHHYAYKLGISEGEPVLSAKSIVDKNGHILPFVIFEGGKLSIHEDALKTLSKIEAKRS